MHYNFEWTQNIIDKMKEMYKEGKSAQEIADKIGAPSRNAVIGKLNRMKGLLPPRYVQPQQSKPVLIHKNKINFQSNRNWVDIPIVIPKVNFTETSNKLPLESLKNKQCRYPHGNEAPFGFCGQETHEEKPYCPYHYMITRGNAPRTNISIPKEQNMETTCSG